MLSDDDKNRILAEERYRQEVRSQLSHEQGSTKLWKFLNSSFGIWLLTTVVIGTLTWAYTRWENERAAKALFRSNIAKIDIEINSRIQGIYDTLSSEDALDFYSAIIEIRFSVYNEFSERTTRSLIIELTHLVPKNEQPDLKKALRGLVELNQISQEQFSKRDTKDDVPPEILNRAKKIIVTKIAINRWPLVK